MALEPPSVAPGPHMKLNTDPNVECIHEAELEQKLASRYDTTAT